MPVYESVKNADNKIKISESAKNSAVFGWEKTLEYLAEQIKGGKRKIAIDGWYGIDYNRIAKAMTEKLNDQNLVCDLYDASELYIPREDIVVYNKEYVTDDPGFGRVNDNGVLEDILDDSKVDDLINSFKNNEENHVKLVFGCGSAVKKINDVLDLTCYIDNTHQKVQWDMWEGRLVAFGGKEPTKGYNWKEYHYSDYYLLKRQKDYMYLNMDYYIENYELDDLNLIPKAAYDEMMSTLVKYPIHEVKIFSPGPWGAYRFLDMDYGVEGLSNNAWNKIGGPELRILVDFGGEKSISMPMLNCMQYGKELVGELIDETYPGLFPLDIWLDDGYHPEPQTAERMSMPMHIHPSTRYVQENFNEPLGRYETYHIVEAYEGANTWMGFKDEADIEAWERACIESNNITPIENWRDYMVNWESKEGDLYLIPPGTMHCHGGNQMVLEMDTNPSINGTEYSFFEYDFARPSWDDEAKSMTGKPLKMHLEHGFDMEHHRRESWVKDNLLAKPSVVKWTKDYWIERYSSRPNMPYHVERIHFDKVAEYSTEGKFMHMLTPTVGGTVIVRSKENPEYSATCDKFSTLVIPASFGDYEIVNENGGRETVVIQRWKKG